MNRGLAAAESSRSDCEWGTTFMSTCAGARQVAVSAAAATEQADPLAKFQEHQKAAARLSVAEEARMLMDVNRRAERAECAGKHGYAAAGSRSHTHLTSQACCHRRTRP